MELPRKLQILADAAKYDASCASSGTKMRDPTARASAGARLKERFQPKALQSGFGL